MGTNWNDPTVSALISLWEGFLLYLPNLILGTIILIVGWLVAGLFGELITQILKKIKFDNLFEEAEWKEALNKAKIKIQASKFIGSIVKWIIYILVLWLAVGVFGLAYFAEFMGEIIRFIPNVIVASLIFVIAVILADFLSKIVVVATQKASFKYTDVAGEITKWAIWIFAGFAILIELGIAEELLMTLFTGIIIMVAIAGGIAFGLGGKETAREVLKNLEGKFKE